MYDKFCLQFYGASAPRIDVPNDTRISGTILMYQKFLRSRNLLTMFCANNAHSSHFIGNEISPDEWRIIAEVVSVLHGVHVLVFQSQTDTSCAISTAWIECMVARHKLLNQNSYIVADIDKSWTPFDNLESLPTKVVEVSNLTQTTKN